MPRATVVEHRQKGVKQKVTVNVYTAKSRARRSGGPSKKAEPIFIHTGEEAGSGRVYTDAPRLPVDDGADRRDELIELYRDANASQKFHTHVKNGVALADAALRYGSAAFSVGERLHNAFRPKNPAEPGFRDGSTSFQGVGLRTGLRETYTGQRPIGAGAGPSNPAPISNVNPDADINNMRENMLHARRVYEAALRHSRRQAAEAP